ACPLSSLSAILVICFVVADPLAIYTLSLHDALPISTTDASRRDAVAAAAALELARQRQSEAHAGGAERMPDRDGAAIDVELVLRSEEHTSELQSLRHLVCRLLLEKKKELVFSSRLAG